MSTQNDTPELEKVMYKKPKSVVETVTEYLRESIVDGVLKPGQRLNSKEIMKTIGVSNIPLREAVRTLEKEGLIHSRSGRGYWIADVSRKDLSETFEMREMMEIFAVGLIERQAERDSFVNEKLMIMAADEKKQGSHSQTSVSFHESLIQLTQNQKLISAYSLLATNFRRYQMMSFTLRHKSESEQNEHTPIITALCQGKYEEAKAEIRKHLRELKYGLLEHLDLELNE